VLFYVLFVLYRSLYCLCVYVYCTVLYCTVLYCTVLYCTVLYCTVLQPPGGYPIVVKYISYHIISYHISYIISYHIIIYHTISYHIVSYHISYIINSARRFGKASCLPVHVRPSMTHEIPNRTAQCATCSLSVTVRSRTHNRLSVLSWNNALF
jgi:hypothetical protein